MGVPDRPEWDRLVGRFGESGGGGGRRVLIVCFVVGWADEVLRVGEVEVGLGWEGVGWGVGRAGGLGGEGVESGEEDRDEGVDEENRKRLEVSGPGWRSARARSGVALTAGS